MDGSTTIDVSNLPEGAIGRRASLWWGMLGLVTIESMVFALVLASYFYLRLNSPDWPPAGTPRPDLMPGTINTILLLLSCVPVARVNHLSKHGGDKRAVLRGVLVWVVMAIAMIVVRFWEFQGVNCRWDSHAYGSSVWALLFLHLVHVATSAGEAGLLGIYLLRYPLDDKHRSDLNTNCIYWYFVVLSWLAIYAAIYFSPRIF